MKKKKESKQILRCFILNEAEYNLVVDLINTGLSAAKAHELEYVYVAYKDLLDEFVAQCEMQGGF